MFEKIVVIESAALEEIKGEGANTQLDFSLLILRWNDKYNAAYDVYTWRNESNFVCSYKK